MTDLNLQPATKQDIDELKQSTKQDIDELKQSTKQDIDELKQSTKRDLIEFGQKLEEKISHLPTKEEFFNSQDKLMGGLKAIREENAAGLVGRKRQEDKLENHESRITNLETKVGV